MKHILPLIALLAVFAVSFATAGDLSTWKTDFANAKIVVGSNLDIDDIAAATAIFNKLGLEPIPAAGGGEECKIERTTDRLNLGDKVYDIKSSLDKDELPTLLADGTYRDSGNKEFKYNQKIEFGDKLVFTHFANTDYKGGEPTLGFPLAMNDVIANYTLDFFVTEPDWSADALKLTTLKMMNHDYYIKDVDTENRKITLLDTAARGIVTKNETSMIGGKQIGIHFISENEVRLKVDGEVISSSLGEGDTFMLPDGTYIGVIDIMYAAGEPSSAEIFVGKGTIEITDGANVEINDKVVYDLIGYIKNTTKLDKIILQWKLDEEAFLTKESSLTFPGFETFKLEMEETTFPKEEVMEINGGGKAIELKVNIKSGKATIYPLYMNESGVYVGIGKDKDHKLVTTTSDSLLFNKTAGDEKFVATYYNGGREGESYLLKVILLSGDKVKISDTVSNTESEELKAGDTYSIGNVDLKINKVNYTEGWVNISALTTDVNFHTLFTKEGLLIFLPQNDDQNIIGYIDLPTDQPYNVTTKEENKDGTLGEGEWINYTVSKSSNDRVSVTNISTNFAGSGPHELPDKEDHYEGYVESDLATKIEWDKSGDEYDVKAIYHGGESYGNLYIRTVGAPAEEGRKYYQDTEPEGIFAGSPLIVIGGSAINIYAAKLLGFTNYTYGYQKEWQDATGVTGLNMGFLKVWENPTTVNVPKALLIAGWEGPDTKATAEILITPPATIDFTNRTAATIDLTTNRIVGPAATA